MLLFNTSCNVDSTLYDGSQYDRIVNMESMDTAYLVAMMDILDSRIS